MTKKIDEWIHKDDRDGLEEALEALTGDEYKPQARQIMQAKKDMINFYEKEGG